MLRGQLVPLEQGRCIVESRILERRAGVSAWWLSSMRLPYYGNAQSAA